MYFLIYFLFRLGQQKLFISFYVWLWNGFISLNVHVFCKSPWSIILSCCREWVCMCGGLGVRSARLIAVDATKLCFRPSALWTFGGHHKHHPNHSSIKTDTAPKKHEELKCAEIRETTLTTKKKTFSFPSWFFFTYTFYTFICYLITRRCCCLNKIIAVHDVRLISSE